MSLSSLPVRVLVLLLASAALSACKSSPESSGDKGYRAARAQGSLEVPPDLLSTTTLPAGDETGSQLLGATGGEVLPEVGGVVMRKKGQLRWLEVDAPAEEVWPRLETFVQAEGLPVVQFDPENGVIETDWMEGDARIESAARSAWRRIFGNMVGTASNYNKFRIRIERTEDGRTEVYVIHRVLDKVAVQGPTPKHVISTIWQEGKSDPELEYAMLSAIKASMGKSEEVAEATELEVEGRGPAQLFRENPPRLLVPDNIDTVWKETGVALAHAGMIVEGSDAAEGYYEVLVVPKKKKGFFSKMFKRNKEARYRVELKDQVGETEITVRKLDGTDADTDEALGVLEMLKPELDQ